MYCIDSCNADTIRLCAQKACTASLILRLPHPEQIVALLSQPLPYRAPWDECPRTRPRNINNSARFCLRARGRTAVEPRYPRPAVVVHRLGEKAHELVGAHEFAVGVRAGCDEPERLLCGEDGEEVGERRARDGREEEVAAWLCAEREPLSARVGVCDEERLHLDEVCTCAQEGAGVVDVFEYFH